jgi:hypothetical protein
MNGIKERKWGCKGRKHAIDDCTLNVSESLTGMYHREMAVM